VSNETILAGIVVLILLTTLPGGYALYRQFRDASDNAARMDELEEKLGESRLEIVMMHSELARVGFSLEQWKTYARQLAHAMDEAGMPVPLSPDELAEQASLAQQKIEPSDASYNTAALLRRMARAFNVDELHSLAFQMGIEAGELRGETFETRAISLIEYVKKRGRLAELVALCRQLRPNGRF
jgi:hypothetical protein